MNPGADERACNLAVAGLSCLLCHLAGSAERSRELARNLTPSLAAHWDWGLAAHETQLVSPEGSSRCARQ